MDETEVVYEAVRAFKDVDFSQMQQVLATFLQERSGVHGVQALEKKTP